MADRLVAMRMAVWLRTLPAFVLVPVVIVVDMECFVRERLMDVLDLDRIVRRPEDQRDCGARSRSSSHDQEGRTKADRRAKPAGGWIGDEPTGVRESELRGEDGGPAVGIGGAAQEQPPGRADRRRGGTEQGP